MNDFDLSREQVRNLDRRATEEYGVPGIVLMENAGRGCAELLMRLNPERLPTVVLCGPGNNGGDGFVIARHLENAGWPMMVIASAESYRGDAKVNFDILERSSLNTVGVFENLPPRHWVVDAYFGTGLTRALEGTHAKMAGVLNDRDLPVLAIDIPSGLDCDTGEPLGAVIRATHTATFVAPKLGFRNPNAKQYTGEVHVIDIGAPRVLVDQYRQANARNS